MNLKSKQYIDHIVGPVLCSVLTVFDKLASLFPSYRRGNNRNDIRTILVIKFWGMGSILLCSAGLKQLKKSKPEARIIFLTLKRNFEILKSLDICDEVEGLEIEKGITVLLVDIVKLLFRLKKKSIDLVIDFEFFTRFSAIISYLVHANSLGGFYDPAVWRGNLHTIKVPFNRYWPAKKNFENLIARSINTDFPDDLPFAAPRVTETDIASLKEILHANGISERDDIICVNANAGELALERRWPQQNFILLIQKLLKEYKSKIILVGSSSERPYVQSIVTACGNDSIVNCAGMLSVRQLAALFTRSKMLITNDSGPLHLAIVMGTATVSFFGPETPLLYGPHGEKHIVFYKNIDCSPCMNVHTGKMVQCVKNSPECLKTITVDDVFDKIKLSKLLG